MQVGLKATLPSAEVKGASLIPRSGDGAAGEVGHLVFDPGISSVFRRPRSPSRKVARCP